VQLDAEIVEGDDLAELIRHAQCSLHRDVRFDDLVSPRIPVLFAELATPRTPPYHQRMDPNRSLSVGAATVPTTGSPR
jgi:hypothetical protein